jgi:hypothetical protein
MVDLVGTNGATERPADKICPLAWAPMMQQAPHGLALPNSGLGFVAGNCVRERCGWWSEQHERCSVVSIGGLQSHLLEIADQASVAVHRMRPTRDELEDAGFRIGQAAAAADPVGMMEKALEAAKSIGAVQAERGDRAARGRERIADELRRLRHALLGVYDAARQLFPHTAPDPDELEAIGRASAGDERSEDKPGGETPGEPG